jgi:toxin ParE1/3/4
VRVIFTLRAERHINRLHEYIAGKASEDRADAYIARIVASCTSLATFPMRGQKRDDLLPGLRTIGFERRVTIAFVVTANAVLIEGIFYGGQDFEATFRKPKQSLR